MKYVIRKGELIPIDNPPPKSGVFHAMPDIKPFVTQDGVEITSRSKLRTYEQKNGVKQVGNDMRSFHQKLRDRVYGGQKD